MVVREDSIRKESSHKEEDRSLEDLDLAMTDADTNSRRTGIGISGSMEQSADADTVTLGRIDVAETETTGNQMQMDTTPASDSESSFTKCNVNDKIEPATDGVMNAIDGDNDGDGDDETSGRIREPASASAMKFQPLQPIPEKSLSPGPHSANIIKQTSVGHASREGGFFMNNIQDPVAASKVFKKHQAENDDEYSHSSSAQQMSHTPPTSTSASYETMRFGKRPRSGSLSERLLVSTELEEKGIINRDQKGILKDLIISGQDNEIQHALDRYEQGDATMLEGILHSGSLCNKATEEIDLLGQLDFDFLNVKEKDQQHEHDPNTNVTINVDGKSGSVASDGIGDLEFDGGIGNWEQGEHGDNRSRSNSTWSALENRTRANSTWSALELALQQQQQRSRANSAMSIDLDNFRSRSNSLFSPLIGNQTPDTQANFGRWMESSSASGSSELTAQQQEQKLQQQQLMQQQLQHQHHFQQLLTQQKQKKQQKQKSKTKPKLSKPARRKSAPPGTRVPKQPSAAAIAKEQLKEQKRKERLLKKELKEKEKQQKKEMKERAKREKQKKKEGSEQQEKAKDKEVHIPGSGRPRSMSDPNIKSKVGEDGLLNVERPDGWIGAYSPESRKVRIGRFLEKRNHRVWTKTVKYDVRKNFADSRLRVKGRFVKKDDELLMRELMSLT
eukprot:CAMPEP_0168304830 /NCGR_PEP_ID=MMETSP0142_2-20121227/48188_1 /TAXON_ID=44445 /ORGANISM="Pseudo-nitzschia australis, Strain 10249 10 AB" /LENGTH=673 /DNA_ID=CAMNT_0008256159 /DNA_START=398 /DNA_END=2419 /DNA_ORIENTATION=+